MKHSEMYGVEEWRPVYGWEDRYEVSSWGRVRSKPWLGPPLRGKRRNGRVLSPCVGKYGYKQVGLSDGSRRATGYIHRMMLEAFVCPCPAGHAADHINRNRLDNRLANLRWLTFTEQNFNTKLYKSNKSGFRGVALHKSNLKRPWIAYAWHENERVDLGTFKHRWQAIRARLRWEREMEVLDLVHNPAVSQAQQLKG